MRHRKRTINKLGRDTSHREAMLANLVCSLIEKRRVRTTLAKAKAARKVAEKMVTLGKRGDLHARRLAISRLHNPSKVGVLFSAIAPAFKERAGGYTRILKLGRRGSDSSEMALLEWVDYTPPVAAAAPVADAPAGEKKD
jgi:large subunit ribosomal protein L17